MHKKRISGKDYFYTSVRDKGRVKTLYLGDNVTDAGIKERRLKEQSIEEPINRSVNFPFWVLPAVIILFLILIYAPNYTGFAVFDSNEVILNINKFVSPDAVLVVNGISQSIPLELTDETGILGYNIKELKLNLKNGNYVVEIVDNEINVYSEEIEVLNKDVISREGLNQEVVIPQKTNDEAPIVNRDISEEIRNSSVNAVTLQDFGIMAAGAASVTADLNMTYTGNSTKYGNNATCYNVTTTNSDTVIHNWWLENKSDIGINLPFDINTVASVKDYSGYGNDGTINGEINWNSGCKTGGCYNFSGKTGSYISLGNNPIVQTRNNFSIDTWVYFKGKGVDNAGGTIAGKYDTAGWLFYIYDQDGATPNGVYFQSDGSGWTTQTDVPKNEWHYITYTRNGTDQSFYLDGVLKNVTSNAVISSAASNFLIGDYATTANQNFNGSIDEFKFYNRTLSLNEILDHNNSIYNKVRNDRLVVGQNWTCQAYPNNNTGDGVSVNSSNLFIVSNAIPVIENLNITSTNAALNDTNQNISINFVARDLDNNEAVTNITNWWKNNESYEVLVLPMDRNINSTQGQIKDYTKYGTNVTLGNVTASTQPAWTNVGCMKGGCYILDGKDDFINLTKTGNLIFVNQTSVELWINFSSRAGNNIIIQRWGSDSAYLMYMIDANTVRWLIRDWTGTQRVTSATVNTNGKWYHLVGTANLTGVSLYVDGVLKNTASKPGHIASDAAQEVSIGAYAVGGSNVAGSYLNATIDEVRFYNRSLSPEEVIEHNKTNYNYISAQVTTEGDRWKASVWANDNTTDSIQYNTSEFIVLADPAIGNITISPDPANTTDTLNCTAAATDLDGDSLTFAFQWYNGTTLYNSANVTSTPVLASSTITTGIQVKGEAWNCTVRINDTRSAFSGYNSTIITISNAAPGIYQNGTIPNSFTHGEQFYGWVNTSDIDLDTIVGCNFTYVAPNGTMVVQNQANTSSKQIGTEFIINGTNYRMTNLSQDIGTWTWNATCTDGSWNSTIFNRFTTINNAPSVPTVWIPTNNSNITTANVSFEFNSTDSDGDTITYWLYLNGIINNSFSGNFSLNMPDGNYNWTILASDVMGNSSFAPNRTFTVLAASPSFDSVVNTPNTTAELDLNLPINVSANISTITGTMSSAILQWKYSTSASWTNITMTPNETGKTIIHYNATFIPTAEGNVNYQIYANNTIGKASNTSITNLSIANDYTWEIDPTSFGTISGILTTTKEIGNLTINNTGDFTLSFDLSDNSPYASMIYNDTEPFSLAAKASKTLEVNATFGTITREDDVNITITSTTTGATPSSNRTTITLASYAGGPYFATTIVSSPTSANQGDSINLSSKVKNIGNETAYNLTINWTLPTGWSNTSGNISNHFDNITTGTIYWNNISVNISTSTASPGTYTITVNGSSPTKNMSKTATVDITINCKGGDGICGNGCNTTTDTDCVTTTTSTSSGGGGGGGGESPGIATELLSSISSFEAVRGRDNQFSIPITNTFKDSILTGMKMELRGFLAQYITVYPAILENIKFGEIKNFTIKINAPNYMDYGNYTLDTLLTGLLITRTSTKQFSERKDINLLIEELSREEAETKLNEAKSAIEEMIKSNFKTNKISKILYKALTAFDEKNYGLVVTSANEILDLKKTAFDTYNLIQELNNKISDAESRGLSVEETKKLASIAIASFEREDYVNAQKRIKDGELTNIIETKGKINIINFLMKYWMYILGILIVMIISGMITYARIMKVMIFSKLRQLDKEEVAIKDLIARAQKECFVDKKISVLEYYKKMYEYNKRLEKLRHRRIELRSKRVGLVLVANELENLKRENNELLKLIKELQVDYFEKKRTDYATYTHKMDALTARRVDVERSLAMLEAKALIEKKKSKFIFFKNYFNKVNEKAKLKKEVHKKHEK